MLVNWISLPPTVIVFYRVLLGSPLILGATMASGRGWQLRVGSAWRYLVAIGLLLAFGWTTLFQAMKILPISEAVLLNYTAPIFVAVLAPLTLRERLDRYTLASLSISVTGMLLISLQHGFSVEEFRLFGAAMAAASGLSYAFVVILSKKTLRTISSLAVASYSYLVCAVVMMPVALNPLVFVNVKLNDWLMLALLGFFNTAFATTLYFSGLSRIRAQDAAILSYLEPASTVIYGAILLGQEPTFATAVGGVLIVFGGYIVVRRGSAS